MANQTRKSRKPPGGCRLVLELDRELSDDLSSLNAVTMVAKARLIREAIKVYIKNRLETDALLRQNYFAHREASRTRPAAVAHFQNPGKSDE
jgi:predicted transcriptional regulator